MKIERLFVNICFLRGVCLLACFAFLFSYSFSQTSDDQFRQPLKKVIVEIGKHCLGSQPFRQRLLHIKYKQRGSDQHKNGPDWHS